MGKFNQNELPEGTEIIAEMDMKPVIAAINEADVVPDQNIQGGVCLAMCLKWVESGVRNLDFWNTLTQDETLNDIKWLQHRETAVRQEMARVAGLPMPSSGEYKLQGIKEDIQERYDSLQLTIQRLISKDLPIPNAIVEQKARLKQLESKSKVWFGEAVQERTGLKLDQKKSFSNRDEVEGVAWEIATGDAGYYVLGIYGNGGHAIAVHVVSDNEVHLMDSAYGELKFAAPIHFIKYFAHHMKEYEGDPLWQDSQVRSKCVPGRRRYEPPRREGERALETRLSERISSTAPARHSSFP